MSGFRFMSGFRIYPHDLDRLLDGLVLSVHGFDEENNRGKLYVCKEGHTSSSNRKISEVALATGCWVGDMPCEFDGATAIERGVVAFLFPIFSRRSYVYTGCGGNATLVVHLVDEVPHHVLAGT